MNAFTPSIGETVSISATASNANASITMGNNSALMVTNTGTALCYTRWDDSAPTATTSDVPIPAGASIVFSVPDGVTHVAAICDSGESTTIKFTPGEGV